MEKVQQIVPISHLRTEQDEILTMMDSAPVILTQRHKPRAVMVSVEQWDESADRMHAQQRRIARLEGYIEAKRNLEEMRAEPSTTTTLSELCARYNVVEPQAAT